MAEPEQINGGKTTMLSPSQGVQLMAIGVMIRDGEIRIEGDSARVTSLAASVPIDVSQEIALQIGTEPEEPS